MTYDPAADGFASYTLALGAIREREIRAGRLEPQNETERRWAAAGPVPVQELEAGR